MTVIIAFVLRSVIVALAGLAAAQFLAKRGPAYVSLCYKATLVALLIAAVGSFSPIPTNSHALHIPTPAASVLSGREPAQRVARQVAVVAHSAPAVSAGKEPEFDATKTVSAVWLLGILLLLVRVLAAQFSLWRLKKQAMLVADPKALLLLASISNAGDVPSLLVHPSIQSPCLAGSLGPRSSFRKLLWEMKSCSPYSPMRWSIYSKTIASGSLLQRITCSILWFNPFVWLACKRFDEAIEEHCDQVVISTGCERPLYARVLLELAQKSQTPNVGAALSAGVVDFRSTVGKRVGLVLDASRMTASVVSKSFRVAAIPAAALLAIGVSVMISGDANAQMSAEQMKNEKSAAALNAKFLDLALIMYTNDYDDVLPYVRDMDTLKTVTAPYVKTNGDTSEERRLSFDEVWKTHNPSYSVFLFNFALGGVNLDSLKGGVDTVQLYDSKPWPDGTRTVAFLDGHVKAESKDRWEGLKKYLTENYPRQATKPLLHQVLDESRLGPGPNFGGSPSAPPAGP